MSRPSFLISLIIPTRVVHVLVGSRPNCTRRLDAVSDGTAVSRPLPAQCGQFLGRTFWRGRKLTLNLTKRRAHTPSIKNRSNGPAYGAGALRLSRCRSKYTSAALNNIIHDE